jgi:hypothetical protein
MGTWREHVGNKGKMKKILPSPTQNLKEIKIKALWMHAEPSHWLHEISMFQNCLSPFLTWAKYPHYKLEVLININ